MNHVINKETYCGGGGAGGDRDDIDVKMMMKLFGRPIN